MNKSNLMGLGIMAVASAAVIGLANPVYDGLTDIRLKTRQAVRSSRLHREWQRATAGLLPQT
ncbi:MAG: hypothetical protein LUK37_14325 [Clostridia bacterium]|nr:hypothetical protein [Clostridia bacterium]